jgi:hypothetical protein
MKMSYNEIWSVPVAEYVIDDIESHKELHFAVTSIKHRQGVDLDILEGVDNNFTKWANLCAVDYITQFSEHPFEVVRNRSWVTVQNYGEKTWTHSHSNVDVIGVYYLNAVEGHPELELYDPRPPNIFNTKYMYDGEKLVCDCARLHAIKPLTGKIVFFPGYLMHGIGANLLQIPRVSMGINFGVDIIR